MASQSTTSEAEHTAARKHLNSGESQIWERCVLVGVLALAAGVYSWKLDQNGWANAYYSAAVQAGLHDSDAFFYGSADWGNSITVDKPPLSLWLLGASVRLFGLNSWSLLLPQVAITIGSTYIIYRLVRQCSSAPIALLAAGIFATTPITVLMARYNNPDPLMVLLMLCALYFGIRATEKGQPRLLYVAAIFLALGFLTKQLQAFLVLPAIVSVFLIHPLAPWYERIGRLMLAGCVLTAGSLAWPLAVDLAPANTRPYVGGSTSNSMIELTLGYNGVDRILQHEDPSTALIPQEMRSVNSDAGFFRLLNANYGQEIGWLLLPALLSSIVIAVRLARRSYSRAEAIFASASLIWLVTTYLILSFMGESFHSYYTASLAPPLTLCLTLGVQAVLTSGKTLLSRLGVVAAVVSSFIFWRAMWQLSDVYPEWLGLAALIIGLSCGALLLVPPPRPWIRPAATWTAVATLLAGPVLCSVITVATPQEGSNPLSGGISRNTNTLSRFLDGIKKNDYAWAAGLAIGMTPSPGLSQMLKDSPQDCRWAAATYPGQTAARVQLAADRAVMPLGGFAATDPSPTLKQFQDWVAEGQICYLVLQPEQLKVPGNSFEVIAINEWVKSSFGSEAVDGVTVYRLAS